MLEGGEKVQGGEKEYFPAAKAEMDVHPSVFREEGKEKQGSITVFGKASTCWEPVGPGAG